MVSCSQHWSEWRQQCGPLLLVPKYECALASQNAHFSSNLSTCCPLRILAVILTKCSRQQPCHRLIAMLSSNKLVHYFWTQSHQNPQDIGRACMISARIKHERPLSQFPGWPDPRLSLRPWCLVKEMCSLSETRNTWQGQYLGGSVLGSFSPKILTFPLLEGLWLSAPKLLWAWPVTHLTSCCATLCD